MLVRFLAGVTTKATPAETFRAGEVRDLPVASALHWITRGLAVEQPIPVISVADPPPPPRRRRVELPATDAASDSEVSDEPDRPVG